MKKYLADILTLMRFLLALFLLVLVLIGGEAGGALIVFVLAELTDAFDGFCAKKWPFPPGKEPKYQRYAEKYDMMVDTFLLAVMALFVVVRLYFWPGIIFGLSVLILCSVVELIAYGKFFGHPGDCRRGSLYAKDPKRAEQVLLLRRKLVYIPTIVLMVGVTLMAADWRVEAKTGGVIFGLILGEFLWRFLKPRREKVARE